MNNITIMKKVKELYFQPLHSREQSYRIMMEAAIIRKVFGINENEIEQPSSQFEREPILSDSDIKNEFKQRVCLLQWAIEKQDVDKQSEYKNHLEYFIGGVNFFNGELAEELKAMIA